MDAWQVRLYGVTTTFKGDVEMKLFPTIAVLSMLAAASTAHAADPNLGRNLAATCANCHGTNGKAVTGSGLDPLAGEDKGKIGAKPATIMHQIAKGYTDEQLDLIAAYFAVQK
jgi:cytochrome c553